MIAILTDQNTKSIGESLKERLAKKEQTYNFVLKNTDIKPCYSCGGCKTKTYKRCVFRDEMDKILPYIAKANALIVITPIVFGGYSFCVKLAIDKLALIGDLHYYTNGKEIVKGKKNEGIKYFAIGIPRSNTNKDAEIVAFKYLVEEMLIITGWQGKCSIYDSNRHFEEIAEEILL